MQSGTVVILHQGEVITSLLHWVRRLPSNVALETPQGNEIARQRNMGAAKGLAGDWVLFVDSDSVPDHNTLPLLLSRDVDLISAVVCMRTPPWSLCAVEGPVTAEGIRRVELSLLPRDGIRKVTAAGAGCLLVRRRVFDLVPFPWFRCGQIRPDLLHEDTGFCLSAAAVGIPTYLDCEVRVGHDFGGGIVKPGRDGQPWIEWKDAQRTTHPMVSAVSPLLVRSEEWEVAPSALTGVR
jgi:hypothetical protein